LLIAVGFVFLEFVLIGVSYNTSASQTGFRPVIR